ncbi:hypothetical protein Nepgr_020038 [Nepenthes gracilis]|uniref:Uncharacterized protein n=1 Tax=Nepenthes gracilis TaxID=150966 RepID=A0AAD3SX87_NEPGR|nr:hypothetical protein Nepgr_020038 [Nepenthes gracilis]
MCRPDFIEKDIVQAAIPCYDILCAWVREIGWHCILDSNYLQRMINRTGLQTVPLPHDGTDFNMESSVHSNVPSKHSDHSFHPNRRHSFTGCCCCSRASFQGPSIMRAPSLLAQCLPGLVLHDRASHAVCTISERDVHLPAPAVEILPSKVTHPINYAGDNGELQGFNVFKGRINVADIAGFTGSEMICWKTDGSFKSWDSSIDLVNVLKHEIRDGQLSFRGKRVLELCCNHGLTGIFACLKGACSVHFQDVNAETIRCTTIPNVLANLEQARDRQSKQPDSPLTPSRQPLAPAVHFYAGDWEELPTVLSVLRNEIEPTPGISMCFSEEDFMDGCSSQDGSIIGQETSSRRSRKLSGSRAWERASEIDQGAGGYDVILMTEIPYSVTSLKKLYALIKKCLRPPYGVVYLAAKKNYVGFNSAARHLRSILDEEGIFGAHSIKELPDREIWKFFLK